MSDVVFIDSSVLLCLIDVPGKNEGRDAVVAQFNTLLAQKDTMILPLATVIETGNHIANLSSGWDRRSAAIRLEKILRDSIMATPPWVVGETRWDKELIGDLVEGVPRTALTSLSSLAESMRVGAGDASIVHEARRYKRQTHVPSGRQIRVWTIDQSLNTVWPSALI